MSTVKKTTMSVVIQTKNTPLMILKRCIQCVRQQTLTDIEILLLDSNSKDSSHEEALLADKELLAGITYLAIPEEGEFVHGKNAALEAAHGEYITFISGQDIMPPTRLEKLVALFQENRSYNVICTDMTAQQNNILENSDHETTSKEYKYLGQLIFYRDCFKLTGSFDPDLVAHGDDDMWVRLNILKLVQHISSEETTISICPECYHGYTSLNAAIGYRQLGVKYESLFHKNKKARKMLYREIASQYKKANVIHRFIQFAVKALLIRP